MTQQPGRGAAPGPVRQGLLANSGALLGSRLVVAVLGWAGTVLVVRRLDTADFGRFAFVFSLVALLSFATDLSSSRIMVKALARPDADRAALSGAYVVLRSLLGLATYLVALGFVVAGPYPAEVVAATAIVGLGLVIGSAAGALDAVFQAEVRLGHVAVADVVGQAAQLALTVAVAVTAPSLLLFVVPALLFDLVALTWKAFFVRRLVVPRLHFDRRLWGSILRQSAPLAAGTALFALSLEAPVVLLSQLDSFEAVARYGVALKFVALAAFLPTALASPLLPLLVRSWPHDRPTFDRTVARALLLLTVAGGAIVVAFVPVAGQVVAFLYGEDYREAGFAAAVAVTGSCSTFATQVAVIVLITVGRNRTYVWAGALSLATTVAGTVLLAPQYSYEGAAVAQAASQVLVVLLLAGLAARGGHLRPLPTGRLALVAGCALAALGLGLVLQQAAPWPVVPVAAVLAFLVLVEATRAAGPGGLRRLLHDAAPA